MTEEKKKKARLVECPYCDNKEVTLVDGEGECDKCGRDVGRAHQLADDLDAAERIRARRKAEAKPEKKRGILG